MTRFKSTMIVAALATLLAGPTAAFPGPAQAATDTTWGPVVTLADRSFDGVESVTTDNGMVVAAWNGRGFNGLWVSVHRARRPWSAPTKVADEAAAFSLQRDGDAAWLA